MSPRWTTRRQREGRSTEHHHYAVSALLPVTPLTPLPGACLRCSCLLLSSSPGRHTVARPHAACTPHSRCVLTPIRAAWARRIRNEICPPVELAFQPSRRGSHAFSGAHRRSRIPGRIGGVREPVEPGSADTGYGHPHGGRRGRARAV